MPPSCGLFTGSIIISPVIFSRPMASFYSAKPWRCNWGVGKTALRDFPSRNPNCRAAGPWGSESSREVFCQNSIDKSQLALIRNVTGAFRSLWGSSSAAQPFGQRQPRCSNGPTVSPHALAYLEYSLGLACAARRLFTPAFTELLSASPRHRPEQLPIACSRQWRMGRQ